MVARKYTYVDFRTGIPAATPVFAITTNAVATSSDNQVDYMYAKGQYFDWIQTGAAGATGIMPIVRTTAPLGIGLPGQAQDAVTGIELTEGMLTAAAGADLPSFKSFTVGTDPAFFIRCRVSWLTNVDNFTVFAIGFRKVVAQADISTEATLGSAYADSCYLGTTTVGGLLKTSTSKASSVTLTALAHAAATAAGSTPTGMDLKVLVSATGAVTYTIDGVADASAVAFTHTNGAVLTPSVVTTGANGTGTCVNGAIIQEYECGWQ